MEVSLEGYETVSQAVTIEKCSIEEYKATQPEKSAGWGGGIKEFLPGMAGMQVLGPPPAAVSLAPPQPPQVDLSSYPGVPLAGLPEG